MNEAALSERLRALREPAPRNGFDERLQQALWREAAELRAERAHGAEPLSQAVGSLRRVRRLGGRVGLGMIIVCGATAAAAAGGIWAAVAYSQRSAPEPAAPRVAPESAAAEVKRVVAAPAAPVEPPSPAEPGATELPSVPGATVVAPPTTAPAVAAERAADPTRAAAREKPRTANPESRAPERSPPSAPAGLVPFELPTRASAERGSAAGSAAGPTSRLERLQLPEPRGAATNADRALPGLRGRADRRSRPDNSASERGAAPPGLEIARERASEKAERGQERAREARERK